MDLTVPKGRPLALLMAFMTLMVSPNAIAQDFNPTVRERMMIAQQQRADTVRVQVAINFFMPGPTDEGEEADKIRDLARRSVYEMAGKECDVLRATIAEECRLESININLHRQARPNMPDGYNISGSLGFRIQTK